MSEMTLTRTPELIAAEINTIHHQTKMVVFQASVEIGRRLVEAKEQLQHGGWMKWLKESVNYSQSTANNFMQLYKEFGDKIPTLGNLDFGNLPYTKALALIGVPEEERENFVKEHDVENMSTRELQQAVKDKQEAEKRAKAAEEAAEKERQAREKLEQQTASQKSEVDRLKTQLEQAKSAGNADDVQRLQQQLEESENELSASRDKIKALEKKLRDTPIETQVTIEVEKVPAEIEAELEELRKKVSQQFSSEATMKFKVHFNTLVKQFQDMLGSLAEIPDEEERGKMQTAVIGLIGKMAEKLG